MPFSRSAFTGFPFDSDRDRTNPRRTGSSTAQTGDDHFRSQLDDLAKRHPEFAEHFQGFPFRSDSLGGTRSRPPRSRGADTTDSPSGAGGDFGRRFADRAFGGGGLSPSSSSRFERFGFPFARDLFDEDFPRTSDPHSQFYHQQDPDSQQSTEFHQPSSNKKPESCAKNTQQESSNREQQSSEQRPTSASAAAAASSSVYDSSVLGRQCEEGSPSSVNIDSTNPDSQQHQQQQQRERGRPKQNHNIQPSNTVDLGQKQEPVAVGDREQRSMSAPPPDSRQRFVSSINIPIIRDPGSSNSTGNSASSNMPFGGGEPQHYQSQPSSQAHQQQQPQSQSNNGNCGGNAKPFERIIPIHIEGRDEPVMPKNTGPCFSSHQQHAPPPQAERIFSGHRPRDFTQFVNRDAPSPPHHQQQQRHFNTGGGPSSGEWSSSQHHHHPAFDRHFEAPSQQQQHTQPQKSSQHQQQQHNQQNQEANQHKQQQQNQQQEQQQQQQQAAAAPKPQQPEQLSGPIATIQSIQKDVSELMSQVEKFGGKPRDKQYLYLDEMLTRNLIKLDNVDTQGQENIRQARKEAIRCIERCIGVLEAKAAQNLQKEQQNINSEAGNQESGEGEKMENSEGNSEKSSQNADPATGDESNQAQAENNEQKSQEDSRMDAESSTTNQEEHSELKASQDGATVPQTIEETPACTKPTGAESAENIDPTSDVEKSAAAGADDNVNEDSNLTADDAGDDNKKDKKKTKKRVVKK